MRGGNCNCGSGGGNTGQEMSQQAAQAGQAGQAAQAGQAGGVKKRAVAKKAAPKRKLTPYNIFVKKQYAILKAKFPNDTAPQIMKKIGAEWRKQ